MRCENPKKCKNLAVAEVLYGNEYAYYTHLCIDCIMNDSCVTISQKEKDRLKSMMQKGKLNLDKLIILKGDENAIIDKSNMETY